MNGVLNIAGYLQRTWAGVLFFTLFIWFAFHLVHGERGYYALKSYQSEYVEKEKQYTALKEKRETLETKVKHLRPGSIDPDLLDEQVRIMLNRMGEDEYILP